MTPPLIVSRAGLTRCASCHAHIEAAGVLAGLACPLCGARAADERAPAGRRSAALAAVFGVSVAIAGASLPACADAPEQIAMPVYGGPPERFPPPLEPEPPPEPPPEPEPPTDAEPPTEGSIPELTPKPAPATTPPAPAPTPAPAPVAPTPVAPIVAPDPIQPSVYGGPPTDRVPRGPLEPPPPSDDAPKPR